MNNDDKFILEFINSENKNIDILFEYIMKTTNSSCIELKKKDGVVLTYGIKDKKYSMKVNIDTEQVSIFLYGDNINNELRQRNTIHNLIDIYFNNDNSSEIFLVHMSHEIRTPLNGVIGYSQLLNQTHLTKIQKSYIRSLTDCSVQLMKTINDILDISRLNSGKMILKSECFSISEIIDNIKNVLERKLDSNLQILNFKIDQSIPTHIIMDKQKLIQVLINLISNASKFSDNNKEIKVIIKKKNNNTLEISVKDDGIGIPSEHYSKIFEPFTQTVFSKSEIGCGLGLAITKKLCKLLGGDINVKSEIGHGTVFCFTVLYKNCDDFEKEIIKEDHNFKHSHVLIINNNTEDERISLNDKIFDIGMIPVTCTTKKEGLSMISKSHHDFKVCIFDIHEEIDANKLAIEVKEINPFLPLIVIVSDTENYCSEFSYKIEKPYNKIQLYDHITSTILKSEQIKSSIDLTSSDLPIEIIDKSSSTNSPPSSVKKNIKILIVEDHDENRKLLTIIIKNFNYENIDVAENGAKAMEMIKAKMDLGTNYDIMLLDIRMPVMNGYQVINQINENNWKKPKIIVMTASILHQEREKCERMGVTYFIEKPIDICELKTAFSHICLDLKKY